MAKKKSQAKELRVLKISIRLKRKNVKIQVKTFLNKGFVLSTVKLAKISILPETYERQNLSLTRIKHTDILPDPTNSLPTSTRCCNSTRSYQEASGSVPPEFPILADIDRRQGVQNATFSSPSRIVIF